jgi:hypothetical protein
MTWSTRRIVTVRRSRSPARIYSAPRSRRRHPRGRLIEESRRGRVASAGQLEPALLGKRQISRLRADPRPDPAIPGSLWPGRSLLARCHPRPRRRVAPAPRSSAGGETSRCQDHISPNSSRSETCASPARGNLVGRLPQELSLERHGSVAGYSPVTTLITLLAGVRPDQLWIRPAHVEGESSTALRPPNCTVRSRTVRIANGASPRCSRARPALAAGTR